MSTTQEVLGARADRSRRSSKALLNAAGELIVEGGFDALTLAAIGERAGYSRGLVTARFGSKEGLIEALLERIVDRWNHKTVLPQTIARPGLEGVVVVLDAIKGQAQRDPTALKVLYHLMFEAVGPNPTLRARFAELHREIRNDFRSLIKRGLRDGTIRTGVNPEQEASLIVSGLRGIVYQWLLDPEHFDPVPAMDHLIASVRRQLSTEEGN